MLERRPSKDREVSVAVSILEEIGRNERHFNTLQSEYRKLASAWLLAALGAFGFVLLSTAAEPTKTALLFLIAMASVAGIVVLWLLDLHVYQRLLESVFIEAMKIEQRYPGLPKPHHAMLQHLGGSAGRSISAFYVAIAFAAPVCALASQFGRFAGWQVGGLIGLPIVFGLAGLCSWRSKPTQYQADAEAG